MALPITIPNTFATETTNIPLSDLDANFTTVTNAINGIGNGSEALANVSITGGAIVNVTATSVIANVVSISNATITGGSITGITDLAVADGGTGSGTASGARTNLGAAALGANSDITSLSGLTTPLSVAQGGIGTATLTANNVLLGNNTSAIQVVAPSTSGNVLTSNGTTWSSSAISSLSVFDKSLVTNGYQKLPGGMIMQWMRQDSVNVSTPTTVNFPISFPTACLNVQITSVTNAASSFVPTITSFSTTGVTFRWERPSGGDNPANFFFLAIGY